MEAARTSTKLYIAFVIAAIAVNSASRAAKKEKTKEVLAAASSERLPAKAGKMFPRTEAAELVEDIENQSEQLQQKTQNGYLMFSLCTQPSCMARIGYQIDSLLGGLAFAKSIGRTLVLTPLRTYKNVDYSAWFDESALRKYHDVISFEKFRKQMASTWPAGSRVAFCRRPAAEEKRPRRPCDMMKGDHFGSVWQGLGVRFDDEKHFELSALDPDEWMRRYPASRYPVMALKRPPSVFPLSAELRWLQKFVVFADVVTYPAEKFRQTELRGQSYIGLHLRNGRDWSLICQQAVGLRRYLASAQCRLPPDAVITQQICLPPLQEVVRKVSQVWKRTGISRVFIATNQHAMIDELRSQFHNTPLTFETMDPWLSTIDLDLLIKSDFLVANCVSLFSAFAVRAREVSGQPTTFFGQ